jgi:hypothetical protein
MAYAVYKGDQYYHVTASAGLYHTLCGLSTKGSRKGVRELRPAARVTLDPPPRYLYDPCPLCEAGPAKSENPRPELNGD